MTAAVFSIGTELTRGELTNSNASWLGERLTELGFDVPEHATVDDNRARIVATLQRLAHGHRVVVCTGGLGPTTDDCTADAVAAALGVTLQRDEATLQRIQEKFQRAGIPMPQSNAKQAELPYGADALPNRKGTAPGFAVTLGESRCFFLPGVPTEMKHLFDEQVAPEIAALAACDAHQIHLRSFGLTESDIADRLADLEEREPGVTLGYRAHFPEIEVKVLVRADDRETARAQAEHVAAEVRERLGDAVFGGRHDRFAGVVGRDLKDRGLTLAVAESCTGGLVGGMLTEIPGSSSYLLLDAVVYSNRAKSDVLGVPATLIEAQGAVSAEVARAMAEGALRVGHTDLAVSITGIAGPEGGSEEKPVGTVFFAVARRRGPTTVHHRRLPGDRARVRTLAAYVALKLVARAADEQHVQPEARGSAHA